MIKNIVSFLYKRKIRAPKWTPDIMTSLANCCEYLIKWKVGDLNALGLDFERPSLSQPECPKEFLPRSSCRKLLNGC
jgi:hypothetical protein